MSVPSAKYSDSSLAPRMVRDCTRRTPGTTDTASSRGRSR
jgi:hypothetical protein